MTATRTLALSPSPQASAVPTLFSQRLLLTETSSVTVKLGLSEVKTELLAHRVTRTASFTKEIHGYRHDGLNE